MPSQVTVTAKTGPAVQNTAIVLTDASRVEFDLMDRTLFVSQNGQVGIKEYDLVGVTTISCTVSGANYTWTVS